MGYNIKEVCKLRSLKKIEIALVDECCVKNTDKFMRLTVKSNP